MLTGFVFSLLPVGAACILFRKWYLYILIGVVILSFVTFGVYGTDKLCAVKGWRRVPEKWLFFLSFAGGMPGAFIAMELFKHKRAKDSFKNVIFLLLALQILLAAGGVCLNCRDSINFCIKGLKKSFSQHIPEKQLEKILK